MINIITTSASLPIALFLVAISGFTSALFPFSPPPRIFFDVIPAEIHIFVVVVVFIFVVFVVVVVAVVVILKIICRFLEIFTCSLIYRFLMLAYFVKYFI